MQWEKIKQEKLKELKEHIAKNKVDEPIIKLINVINKSKNLVTTSTCSGRIGLLEFDLKESKKSANHYKRWHRKINHEELELAISSYTGKKLLWFKVEPFILHVAAKDLNSAIKFLQFVRSNGVKRGGIQAIGKDKIMIEIQGNGNMIIPVDYVEGEWHKIAQLANEMLEKNFEMIRETEKVKI